jgi:hypothetical protein
MTKAKVCDWDCKRRTKMRRGSRNDDNVAMLVVVEF